MKSVKYVGTPDADLPSLGLFVVNGDVIDVPDDFENGLFEDVVTVTSSAPTKQPKQAVGPETTANTATTAAAE